MSTKNPRVNMVLEPPLYKMLEEIAHKDGVSMSQKARDLIKESLEVNEDIGLAQIAQYRRKTFNPRRALTHKQIIHKWVPRKKKR